MIYTGHGIFKFAPRVIPRNRRITTVDQSVILDDKNPIFLLQDACYTTYWTSIAAVLLRAVLPYPLFQNARKTPAALFYYTGQEKLAGLMELDNDKWPRLNNILPHVSFKKRGEGLTNPTLFKITEF
jgi:hypothetical protein